MKARNIILKAVLAVILSVICSFSVITVSAKTVKCSDFKGDNINSNNYTEHSDTVKSYLVSIEENKFLRFQSDILKDYYYIEYYDSSFKLLNSLTVEKELDIFGGFYADNDNYYILSGKKNPDAKSDVEVFRITKYDKDFKRMASVPLKCKSFTPFKSGSARFTKYGNNLIIRTSHESDVQSNLTIIIDTTDNMKVISSLMNDTVTGRGYVSQSFNQFVLNENDKLIALDHGNNSPRSIALFTYHLPISSSDILNYGCELKEVVSFLGEKGDSYTGASVGGFEYSDSSYLVAYNSVIQDGNYKTNTSRDIYVAVVDKITKITDIKIIANNTDGGTFSTPHLVKISNNEFLLLWSKDNNVSFVKLDGKGNILSEIFTEKNVNLSDCKPILSGDRVIWYEYKDAVCTFHSINISDLNLFESTVVDNGHDYELTKQPTALGGNCTVTCKKCSKTKEFKTQSEFNVLWNKHDNGQFSSILENNTVDKGQSLYYKIGVINSSEININFSDTQAVTVNKNSLKFSKEGSYIITFTYKFNPSLKKVFTVNVSHIFDNDTDDVCNYCGFKRDITANIENPTFSNITSSQDLPLNNSSLDSDTNASSNNTSTDNLSSDNSGGLSSESVVSSNESYNEDDVSNSQSTGTNTSSNFILIIVIAVIVLLAITGFLVWYFVFHNKKLGQ